MKINNYKILVLGGTGLVGEELTQRLAKENLVTVVSLGSQIDKNSFNKLQEKYSNLTHITGNIFLPTKFKDKTFNELVDSDLFLEEYLDLLYHNPDYRAFYLYEVLRETQPDIVIDAINSATVLSYTKNVGLIRDYLNGKVVKLETLLATLSIPRLISFFDCLYKSLKETNSIKLYLKIGTTGTGGMGFNIPYTHGEEKPSVQLLEKAAISGAYTSLLYLLSATFGIPQIKEIKPAALVGYKKIGLDNILLGRNSSQSLKIYEFNHTKKVNLNELRKLDFDNFKSNDAQEDLRSVFVDTGENGQFSLEEFRTISNKRQMGFITKEEIADVVLNEINGVKTDKDMIDAFNKTVLGPSEKAQEVRKKIISEMEKLVSENNLPSLAFEILGPPRLSKLIFEAYLIEKETNFDDKKIDNLNFNNGLEDQDKSLIVSTGIPIIFPDDTLLFGKKPKIPSYENVVNLENINKWANEGWVDLRKENIQKWGERILQYKRENNDLEIGDIVAWIFEKEDRGFRKN